MKYETKLSNSLGNIPVRFLDALGVSKPILIALPQKKERKKGFTECELHTTTLSHITKILLSIA